MKATVIVVGGGPVGLTTALLLARHGVRVTVLERAPRPEPRLRAVALDDEALRLWQACGLEGELADAWDGGDPGRVVCRYLTPGDRTFLSLRRRDDELGYPQAVAIHEPTLVARLRDAVRRHRSIELREGVAVADLHESDGGVTLETEDENGRRTVHRCDWLVACDGANSTVRTRLGVAMPGVELPNPWLVANLEDPDGDDHVRIRCDPAGPAVTMPLPRGMRRVEAMLPEDARAVDWLRDEGRLRRALARGWSGAAHAPVSDVALVRFRTAMAERWRVGRVLLAGDAAHVTPPFAGQGLSAGLRDAGNLAFKLAGVVQGWLPSWVLETYELERRPHQAHLLRMATRLGRLMAPRSRAEAVAIQWTVAGLSRLRPVRDALEMRGGGIRPRYRSGFLVPGGASGRYLPQPTVACTDATCHRLDALLGDRMTWVAVGDGVRAGTVRDAPVRAGDTVLVENRDFHDPDRLLQRRLGPGSVVLVRPDRIIHTHHAPGRRTALGRRRPSWTTRPDAAARPGLVPGFPA